MPATQARVPDIVLSIVRSLIADGIEAELERRLGRDVLDSWRRVTDALIEIHLHEAPDMVRVAAEMSSARD